MGTDPEPLWMLIYNTHDYTYSAINYKLSSDIVEYSMKNNMFGICLIHPAQLMSCINHPEPHLICEALHEWCTLHRPDPDEIFLEDFFPNISNKSSEPPIEVDPINIVDKDQQSLLDQPVSAMAPADQLPINDKDDIKFCPNCETRKLFNVNIDHVDVIHSCPICDFTYKSKLI